MKKIAVIYHSGHGHTEHIAECVARGARQVLDSEVVLLKAEALHGALEQLLEFDGIILGSPTYLGGVSGRFKNFMDATGGMWRKQSLKGKLAAGFTGLMAQAGHASPASQFDPGDIKTAKMFGENFASTLQRISA